MATERQRFGNLLRQIHEDWVVHRRDCSQPGFRAVAVYRFGAWQNGIRVPIVRSILVRIHRLLFRFVRNHYCIEIPPTARIGRRLLIGHQGGIVIHPNTRIGNDCLIRHNVTIGSASDDRAWEAPTLGDKVQVGCGAALLGAIAIGNGVRIDANAVVKTDVPPGARVLSPLARTVTKPGTSSQSQSGAEQRRGGSQRSSPS